MNVTDIMSSNQHLSAQIKAVQKLCNCVWVFSTDSLGV